MRLELVPDTGVEVDEGFNVVARVLAKDGTELGSVDLSMTAPSTPGRMRRLVSVQVGAETLDALLSIDVAAAAPAATVPDATAFTVTEL